MPIVEVPLSAEEKLMDDVTRIFEQRGTTMQAEFTRWMEKRHFEILERNKSVEANPGKPSPHSDATSPDEG